MLVVLWGLGREHTLAAVHDELRRLAAPVLVIDQHKVLDTGVELEVGRCIEGTLRTPDRKVDLQGITAAYLRPYDSRRLPQISRAGPASPEWDHALAVDDLLLSWANVTPALVVNRPDAMAANGSKPYQLEQIRRLGFDLPDTLITTDPEAARAFWEQHGTVIYKSISGVRSIVARLGSEHAGRLADVVWCPTQFQQYIPGVDVRVHVVGDEVFACEVETQAVDYRYPGDSAVHIHACSLPRDVEDRCRELSRAMQLPVAGIDLRSTPHGQWFCFEVNPSPGFRFFERATGAPIANAVARLLVSLSP